MNLQPRIVGATLGAVAALAVGGVGLAWAQEAPTTPSTEAPAAEAPPAEDGTAADPDDCPEKGDRGGSGSTGTGATTTDQISL